MGDGELAEGSVWEAVMSASHYELNNFVAVIDRNGLQISGATDEVMGHGDLAGRFRSFGWNVLECDGNDAEGLEKIFMTAKDAQKPVAVIANTTKGCGVSFMENNVKWHHGVPTDEEYAAAMKELDGDK
jgi:transketolase